MKNMIHLVRKANLSGSSLLVGSGEHSLGLKGLAQLELGKRSGEAVNRVRPVTRKLAAKDTKAPKASLTLPSSPTGGSTYDFSVIYKDNKGIKANSLGSGDILVTGNGVSQFASLVSKSSSNKGKVYQVVYRVTAPGGTWDAVDNGSYSISLQAKQVKDISRNTAAAKLLGTFPVNIASTTTPSPTITPSLTTTPSPTTEKIPPIANLSAANLATGGGTTYDFTVTYSDNVAVNASSFDNSDVLVSGPNGYSQLATRVPGNDTSNGTPRTVTYRITAPGGTWNTADNGSYSIALQDSQVSDVSGNFTTSTALGSFQVNVLASAPSLLRYSGTSNSPGIDFLSSPIELDLSKEDSNPSDQIGSFKAAINQVAFEFLQAGYAKSSLLLTNGSITASDLRENDIQVLNDYIVQNNVDGVPSQGFNFSSLNRDEIYHDGTTSSGGLAKFDYRNGGVKYEATFDSQPQFKLVFFIPLPNNDSSTRLNFINSLDGLRNISRLQAVAVGVNPTTQDLVGEIYGLNVNSTEGYILSAESLHFPT